MFCKRCGARNIDGARFCAECGNPLKSAANVTEKRNNSKNVVFCIVGAVIIMIALAVSILMGVRGKKAKEYERYIEFGGKYVENLDYEQAKECYLQAINVAPKELEPYVRLAQIYIDEADIENAEKILEMAELNDSEGNEETNQQFQEVKAEIEEYYRKKSMSIEISHYLKNFEELVDLLNMHVTPSWQFGVQDSYVSDGFYLEWEKQTFSMKNESSDKVMLFSICLGDTITHADQILKQNGWISYHESKENNSYLASIEGRQYLLSMDKDENGNITYWYLNNWPEGEDIEDYLERLQDVEVTELSHEEKIEYIRNNYYKIQENVGNYRVEKIDGLYERYLDDTGKIRKIIVYPSEAKTVSALS